MSNMVEDAATGVAYKQYIQSGASGLGATTAALCATAAKKFDGDAENTELALRFGPNVSNWALGALIDAIASLEARIVALGG